MSLDPTTMERLENVATKAVNKLLGKRFAKMTLPQQVKVQKKFIYKLSPSMGGGPDNVRAGLLKMGGLPADFQDKAKDGQSSEEIKAYYYGCPEFKEFWEKDLSMTEYQFDELLRQALERIK